MTVKMTKADDLWKDLVKERDDWTCQRCGRPFPDPGPARRGLHAHHIFGRGKGSTRHLLINGIALCYGDHRWAHSNPLEFHEWMRERLSPEAYDELRRLSNMSKKDLAKEVTSQA